MHQGNKVLIRKEQDYDYKGRKIYMWVAYQLSNDERQILHVLYRERTKKEVLAKLK